LPVGRPDHLRLEFSEGDDVIGSCQLLRRNFAYFVDPDLQGMIIPNQRGDEQRMPFVLEYLFVRLDEHRAVSRWLQIQGMECGDDVTDFLANAKPVFRRRKTTILPVTKECE
jgi:hypothetical protein